MADGRWWTLLLAAACGLVVACARTETTTAAPEATATPSVATQPDLVLLLVSGLRASPEPGGAEAAFVEALGQPPTTRYPAAYAQSSSAFLSVGSVFTGRYPTGTPMCGLFTGGVRGLMEKSIQEGAVRNRAWCAQIPETTPTLAEVLGLYGYQTALLTSGLVGTELVGRGFGEVEELDLRPKGGTDWDAAEAWASAWWSRHADAPRLLVVVASDMQIAERADVLERMGVRVRIEDLLPMEPSQAGIDPAKVYGTYAEVAGEVGRGFARILDKVGGGPRPLVEVVGATNGYSLIERTGFADMPVPMFTTSYVLDRTVHVPLLVFRSDAPATPDDPRPVELLDIFPTFAALAGAMPPAGIPGSDLAAAPDPSRPEQAYAEFGDTLLLRQGTDILQFRGFLHHGTVLDPQLDERLATNDPGDMRKFWTFFDVARDPFQTQDRGRMNPRFEPLRKAMIAVRKGPAAPPADTWSDPERLWEIRMARSQGYW